MATHSRILAWEIPRTEEPGRLQSMGSQESDTTWQLNNHHYSMGGFPATNASGPITSWEVDGETVEAVSDFIFGGAKITADDYCSLEIKRRLLLEKESYDQHR